MPQEGWQETWGGWMGGTGGGTRAVLRALIMSVLLMVGMREGVDGQTCGGALAIPLTKELYLQGAAGYALATHVPQHAFRN
jgi:hypothetical protein